MLLSNSYSIVAIGEKRTLRQAAHNERGEILEFLDSTIGKLAGGQWYQERAREYGERAWKVFGEEVDVVYWDVGNGWSSIISIIPHNGRESQIQEFWNALILTEDE